MARPTSTATKRITEPATLMREFLIWAGVRPGGVQRSWRSVRVTSGSCPVVGRLDGIVREKTNRPGARLEVRRGAKRNLGDMASGDQRHGDRNR